MRLVSLLVAVGLSTGACVAELPDEDEILVDDVVEDDPDADVPAEDGKADQVWFTPITREYFLPSAKITTETRKLFKSEAEWVEYFGRPSPGIDWTTSWAVFYTPGTQRPDLKTTRGWRAKLARVWLSSTGRTLQITTRLEMNGDCPDRSGRPFVTATIPKQSPRPEFVKFYRSDTTRDCD